MEEKKVRSSERKRVKGKSESLEKRRESQRGFSLYRKVSSMCLKGFSPGTVRVYP